MVTLSASTLGAPGESLQQVLSWLQETSFAGIELRLSVGEIADPTLTRAARRAVRTEIEDAGVMVTGIASYVKVGSAAEDEMIARLAGRGAGLRGRPGRPHGSGLPGCTGRAGPVRPGAPATAASGRGERARGETGSTPSPPTPRTAACCRP